MLQQVHKQCLVFLVLWRHQYDLDFLLEILLCLEEKLFTGVVLYNLKKNKSRAPSRQIIDHFVIKLLEFITLKRNINITPPNTVFSNIIFYNKTILFKSIKESNLMVIMVHPQDLKIIAKMMRVTLNGMCYMPKQTLF